MLFFKVKIYTAIEKANKKYHEDFYKLKEEEAIEAYKEYISAIPKIDDLHHWRTTDASKYSEILSSLIEKYELVDDLKKLINTSVCLIHLIFPCLDMLWNRAVFRCVITEM